MIWHTAFMALLLQVAGTGSVSGTVVSAASGEAVSGVSVALVRKDPSLNRVGSLLASEIRGAPGETVYSADMLLTLRSAIEAASLDGDVDPTATAFAEGLKTLPLEDILELRVSPGDGAAAVFRSSPPTLTDAAGRFSFEGIPSGSYRLTFSANGFATQAWGQHNLGASGVPFTLGIGERKSDIVMRMSAPGAVSGSILNQQGRAVAGVPVNLLRSTYDANGQMEMRRIASTLTDDRGEYRFFYLPPGRYFLSAGHGAGASASAGLLSNRLNAYISPNQSYEPVGLTYYPGVAAADAARAIDVQSGAEVAGINLLVSPPQSFRVRGRIIDSGTRQPPVSLTTTLAVEILEGYLATTFSQVSYNPAADGTFEIPDLSPGAYRITARGSASSAPTLNGIPFTAAPANATRAEMTAYIAAASEAERARPRASAAITVTNADVEGLLLALGVSRTLAGSFRIDRQERPFSLAGLKVELSAPGRDRNVPTGDGPQFQAATADGAFRIRNVLPGEYWLRVSGIPEGYYVKEARLGDTDVLESPLVLSGSDSLVDIVLSPNVANIEGLAVGAAGQPLPGAQVVLIPGNRDRVDLFKPVVADSRGRFAIPSIAPGNYTLAAWEALEPYAYFDPNLMAEAERSGTALRLVESSRSDVSVRVIPAAQR